MRLSIDLGYNTTKVKAGEEFFSFLSTIKEKTHELELSQDILRVEDKEYLIGVEDGFFTTETDRSKDPVFEILFLNAIAKGIKGNIDDNVRIITGLPMNIFKDFKEALINKFINKKFNVTYNGVKKSFKITQMVVFPQSAGIFLIDKDILKRDTIVIDIGGGTIDVSYFNRGQWKEGKTYPLGVNSLYDNLLQKLVKYGVTYSNRFKAEEIIQEGTIFVDGEEIDVTTEIEELKKKRVQEIKLAVQGGFQEAYKYSKIIYVGGGALLLKDYIKNNILDKAQYINVIVYDKIGAVKNV